MKKAIEIAAGVALVAVTAGTVFAGAVVRNDPESWAGSKAMPVIGATFYDSIIDDAAKSKLD